MSGERITGVRWGQEGAAAMERGEEIVWGGRWTESYQREDGATGLVAD